MSLGKYIPGAIMTAVGAALYWIPGLGATVVSIGLGMMIGGAVSLAGALLAPQAADPSYGNKAGHGVDRALAMAYEGRPRYYVLGEREVTGIPISLTTEMDGKKQWVKVLYYFGRPRNRRSRVSRRSGLRGKSGRSWTRGPSGPGPRSRT